MIRPDARVVYAPTAAWREFDGQVAIISTDVSRVRLLNDIGGFIWKRCDNATVADLVTAVCSAYEVEPDTAARDVHDFVTDLASKGMLRVLEAGA